LSQKIELFGFPFFRFWAHAWWGCSVCTSCALNLISTFLLESKYPEDKNNAMQERNISYWELSNQVSN